MKRLPARQFKNDIDEPYVLVCEEAHRYLGSDIGDTLATGRHNGLAIWICVQHLAKLANKATDLIADVLALCGVIFTFHQRNEEDLNILGNLHAGPILDFTPHTQIQQFHDGYDHFMTEQHGFTEGQSETVSRSTGATENETGNISLGGSSSTAKTWGVTNAIGLSQGYTKGESSNRSDNVSRNDGTSWNDRGFGGGSQGSVQGSATGVGNSSSESVTNQQNHSTSGGGSNSSSITTTIGRAIGRAVTTTLTRGVTTTSSHTVTHQHNYLAKYREEEVETGKLKRSVNDQVSYVKYIIRTLDVGQCVVSVWNEPSFVMQAPFVPDEGTPEFKEFMLEQIKGEIYARHDYHFVPDMQRTGLTRKKRHKGMR